MITKYDPKAIDAIIQGFDDGTISLEDMEGSLKDLIQAYRLLKRQNTLLMNTVNKAGDSQAVIEAGLSQADLLLKEYREALKTIQEITLDTPPGTLLWNIHMVAKTATAPKQEDTP